MFCEFKGSISIVSVELGSRDKIQDVSNSKIAVKIQFIIGHMWLTLKVQYVSQTINLFEV